MLNEYPVTFGADPEVFLEREGQVIGSEEVIPEKGYPDKWAAHMVRDGVQAELRILSPAQCRETVGYEIRVYLGEFLSYLKHEHPSVTVSLAQTLTIPQETLDGLSEASRTLGCSPSYNIYGTRPLGDTTGYRVRSAGGHLHFGLVDGPAKTNLERTVGLLDIFVGNTCVLLDRDPRAAERRLMYGRAGEYRRPNHGLEYRTLSNFWLRSYTLWSLVAGLSRLALTIAEGRPGSPYAPTRQWDDSWAQSLLPLFDPDKIQEAINTNNLELAQANWEILKGWLGQHQKSLPVWNVLARPSHVDALAARGIKEAFPGDSWTGTLYNYGLGWDRYNEVREIGYDE